MQIRVAPQAFPTVAAGNLPNFRPYIVRFEKANRQFL
jgi:hypothetical protein